MAVVDRPVPGGGPDHCWLVAGVGQDGGVTRAGLDKQPREVAAMFDAVARRYDLTNTVLSFGLHRGALPRVAGDALRLPFAEAAFGAVTISFGLRNLVDPAAGLAELARVT